MIFTFAIMGLFVLSFVVSRVVEGPAAVLVLGILSTVGGLLTAAIRTKVHAAEIVTTHVQGIANTLQLSQFNTAVELREGESVEDHWRMPIFIANPQIKPITDAYTCVLGGRRALILESDQTAVMPETVKELF